MITGYNTDIRHNDVVFHVQTEDKGASNPCIESLVYVGGQVLAAKRASYQDLLAAPDDERAIPERMERQHRTVIAAIKSGRFDAKLAALASGRRESGQIAVEGAGSEVPRPTPAPFRPTPVPPATPPAAPAPATPQASGPRDHERTLDQVILEYLTSEADQEQLVLTVDGDRELELGRSARLTLRTTSSKNGRPIAGATVHVRMISTIADPQVLTHGETGPDGALRLEFSIPRLDRGTAALIVSAASILGHAEIKHLL